MSICQNDKFWWPFYSCFHSRIPIESWRFCDSARCRMLKDLNMVAIGGLENRLNLVSHGVLETFSSIFRTRESQERHTYQISCQYRKRGRRKSELKYSFNFKGDLLVHASPVTGMSRVFFETTEYNVHICVLDSVIIDSTTAHADI